MVISGSRSKPGARYKVSKDEWNTLSFKPVVTQSVKIKVKLKKDFSAGIYEWIIE